MPAIEQQRKKPPVEVACSRKFVQWLRHEKISLGFSTYQANRLFLIGVNPQGRLSAFERMFDRPMGMYAEGERLWLGSRFMIWKFENALPDGETHNGYDRLYVPRMSYTTAELDVHDLATDKNGRLLFMNTLYSCLAAASETWSFEPLWHPPFITKIAPEDRCHLNGLAMRDGEPAYATSVSRSDVAAGWRKKRHESGCVIDIQADEVVLTGLSMPHSPRWHMDRLWVLNSGTGELGIVDLDKGAFEPVCFCPGYMRGMSFHKHYAVIGLSKPRERTFKGLLLDERLKQKDAEAQCGFVVVDLNTGDIAHWLELAGAVSELYDVQVLPGTCRPMALGFKSDEICRVVTTAPWEKNTTPIQRFYVAPEGSSPTAPGARPGVPESASGRAGLATPPPAFAGQGPEGAKIDSQIPGVRIATIPNLTADNALQYDPVSFPRLSVRWRLAKPSNPLLASAALSNRQIAGAALAEIKNGMGAVISWLVAPELRRKGIGAQLLKAVENGLREKNCIGVCLNFRSDWPNRHAVARVCSGLGWSEPAPVRYLYRSNASKIASAPWLWNVTPDETFEVFPWSELTMEERADILTRQAESPWYSPELNPFQLSDRFEPINSLGVRFEGKVMGWMITHRTAPDTIQYTSLCLHPSLQGDGKAVGLLAEAIKRQCDSGEAPVGIFMVDVQNENMVKFAKRHLEPCMDNITELRVTGKKF